MPPGYVRLSFYTFWRTAVDDAKNTSALLTFRNDNFDWIGGSAEYGTDFGHVTDRVQQIDGISMLQQQDKGVAASQCLDIAQGRIAKGCIVSF